MKQVILLLVIITTPYISFAHPGRTDSVGCHTCRTNCSGWGLSSGEYHCHRSKGLEQPLAPVRSVKDERLTVPAPEYATPKQSPGTPTAPIVSVPSKLNPINNIKTESWLTRLFNFLFK